MTEWVVSPFAERDAEDWERLVRQSGNGTLLHTRSFLDYHRDRFVDCSLVIRDADGRAYGILPAAQSLEDDALVVSHPGATFGGLLTDPHVTGRPYAQMMQSAFAALSGRGYRSISYRTVPAIYHTIPREEDLWCLWRLGGRIAHRQLSACIDLDRPMKRPIRAYSESGRDCTLHTGSRYLPALWPIVQGVLRTRHNTRPVHTLAEIVDISERFPADVETIVAVASGKVVGGAVLFCSSAVVHMQYGMSSPEGMAVHSGDLLAKRFIERATERKARFFDFGISTNRAGTELNEGLHKFKMKFGAGTIVYDDYEIALANSALE